MDVQITRPNQNWQYDPSKHGFSSGTFLKTISGTPAISSNKLRLNNSEISTLTAFSEGMFSFTLNIPTAPTAGDSRVFGITSSGNASVPVAVFTISGTTFSASVYDRVGTLVATKVCTWSSAWTAVDSIFSIRITERNVFFSVGTTIVARFDDGADIKQTTQLTTAPLYVAIDNNNSDSMDLVLVSVHATTKTDSVQAVSVVRADGSVDGTPVKVTAAVTRPNDTNTYAAGDAVTDSTSAPTIMTFASAARAANRSGSIVAARLIDSASVAVKGSFELWLFDTTVTPDNDNAVFTPTDAEVLTCIGVIPFTLSYVGDATVGSGGNCIYIGTLSEPINFTSVTGNLFGEIVVRNAYIPVAQEIFTVQLSIEQR